MKSKIFLGTNNKAKLDELKYQFDAFGIEDYEFIIPKDLKLESPEETEDSFEGNAKLKAIYYNNHSNLPTITDDTGLCVEALNGMPGVYTANWAEEHGGDLGLFKKNQRRNN